MSYYYYLGTDRWCIVCGFGVGGVGLAGDVDVVGYRVRIGLQGQTDRSGTRRLEWAAVARDSRRGIVGLWAVGQRLGTTRRHLRPTGCGPAGH